MVRAEVGLAKSFVDRIGVSKTDSSLDQRSIARAHYTILLFGK